MKRLIALAFLSFAAMSALAQPKDTTFVNDVGQRIYLQVHTGTGDCLKKLHTNVVELQPNTSRNIDAEKSFICFLYSFFATPATAPLNGGLAQPGETVHLKAVIGKTESMHIEEVVPSAATGRLFLTPQPIQTPATEPLIGQMVTLNSVTGAAPATVSFTLASFNDPVNRQSRTDCVQEAWGHWPWCDNWRTCTGWRTQWRCIHHELVLVVTGPDEAQIRAAVNDCLKTAAVAGALSGLVTAFLGGEPTEPAASAFISTLTVCLKDKGTAVTSINVDHRTNWTDWGGC